MVRKSSYKLIAITGKSVFETLELASDFAEPLSHSALKIRFCKAHCEGYLSSLKMVSKSSHKLIAITGKSMFELPPPPFTALPPPTPISRESPRSPPPTPPPPRPALLSSPSYASDNPPPYSPLPRPVRALLPASASVVCSQPPSP
jgi:hypothetical protein